VRISPVASDQHDSLADLLWELHCHEHDPPTATKADVVAHLRERLLAPDSPVTLVVAADDADRVVGLAALVHQVSVDDPVASSARQCELKELFVTERARGRGIGEALVRWAAADALARGAGRMDWHVKADNAQGIAFYERLGGRLVADRRSYRLPHDGLVALASLR